MSGKTSASRYSAASGNKRRAPRSTHARVIAATTMIAPPGDRVGKPRWTRQQPAGHAGRDNRYRGRADDDRRSDRERGTPTSAPPGRLEVDCLRARRAARRRDFDRFAHQRGIDMTRGTVDGSHKSSPTVVRYRESTPTSQDGRPRAPPRVAVAGACRREGSFRRPRRGSCRGLWRCTSRCQLAV